MKSRKALWWLVLCLSSYAADLAKNVSRQSWDTEQGLPQNTVQAIVQTRDGYLWFGTEGGLARFDSERFQVFNTRNTPQIRNNDIRALLEDRDGALWIATADGLTVLQTGRFGIFTTKNGLPANGVTAIFEDTHQRVCAVTTAGAACRQGEGFAVSDARKPSTEPPDATLQRLVASAVLCSYRDREGNLWVGTESSGVTIVRDVPFETFSDRRYGMDSQVRCIYRDRSGAMWFGTDSQGLTRYFGGTFRRYTVADGLSSNVIVSLGEDGTGRLLIGTPDGLNRLEQAKISVLTSSDGLPDDFIRSIYTDADGTVWLGTRRGLARMTANGFQTFTHTHGLGSDLIGSMARDAKGDLWIATLGGLSRFDSKRFRNVTAADGLSNNVITALYVDHDGLWVGTQGGGLNRYVGGTVKRIALPGIPDVIYGITKDAQQNLWLATDGGIVRVMDSLEVVSYGVSDGLRVNECSGGGHPGIAQDSNGGLWFATLRGATFLRAGVTFNQVRPPVVVESITVDNRTMAVMGPLTIGPGANRLQFDYAALSFTSPQKVQFRYRLEGFDKGWLEAGNTRTAFYTNLRPGSYTFHVIARNGDGVWNQEGARLGLRLQAHFYQTWWFAALMLVPLAGAGYGIYRWRVAMAEAQIESRFEAVLGERNRIAREIHDTLAQGFAGVSVQLELVSRKLEAQADGAREHLDQARMLVRSSLAEARRSIWELRSQSSDIEDLASRLSKMAAQMSGGGRPKIAVEVRGTFRPLPARTEDELLRIAQEAMTNAMKHADASCIDVELAFDAKLLRMTIADDGRGFSPTGLTTGVDGHFGLKGMGERASGIGAKLNVNSAPGAGTKLSVEVKV